MNKIIVSLLLITISIFSLCSCASVPPEAEPQENEPPTEVVDSSPLGDDYYYPKGVPETADEIPEKCDYIVQGVLLDDAREDIQYLSEDITNAWHFAETPVLYGATLTTLKITKVFQGDLQPGDEIELGESYYKKTVDGVEKIVKRGYSQLYNPCETGKEYLFCFDKPFGDNGRFSNTYFPMWRELGCYPVVPANTRANLSIEDMTNEELGLGEGDASVYKTLYEGVIEKYMK